MEPLQPGCFYHIYNHANGRESLFLSRENYRFFLLRYKKFIPTVAQTYCYCLMPNHFHLLVKIKNERDILLLFPHSRDIGKTASKQFANLFSSYTQAFNKQQIRMGSLFIKNFKRKQVGDKSYLLKLVCYIHKNPVHHGFCSSLAKWPHSSYGPIVKRHFTFREQEAVPEWFGGPENFKEAHMAGTDLAGLDML